MLMHCQVPVCYTTEESRKQHPDQDTHQDSTSPLISEPYHSTWAAEHHPQDIVALWGVSGPTAEPDTGHRTHIRVLGEAQGRIPGFRGPFPNTSHTDHFQGGLLPW